MIVIAHDSSEIKIQMKNSRKKSTAEEFHAEIHFPFILLP